MCCSVWNINIYLKCILISGVPCSPFCLVLLSIEMDTFCFYCVFALVNWFLSKQLTIIIPLVTQHHLGIRRWRSSHPQMFRRGRISPSVVALWASLHLQWSSASWIAKQTSPLMMASSYWSTSLPTTQACIRSTSPMTWAMRRSFSGSMWWVREMVRYYIKLFNVGVQRLHKIFKLWIYILSKLKVTWQVQI